MVRMRLYVEGGGDSKVLRTRCRRGFRAFLEKAGLKGRMPRVVACGNRQDAYDAFVTAEAGEDGRPFLLVDAEEPVQDSEPWDHLNRQAGWERPATADDGQCHLMVQIMEAWFLADRSALEEYFGSRFEGNALPGNPNVEEVPKADLLTGLQQATRKTQKGRYDKARHSFELLAVVDPQRVTSVSLHARRFLDSLGAEGAG